MRNVTVPSWMVKVLITAIIGGLVTGVFAWGQSTTENVSEIRTENTVLKVKVERTEKDIQEIKQSQRRIEDKLDDVLQKRR